MSVDAQPALRIGDTGEAVLDVQSRLAALGYAVPQDERGSFGLHTESAVKAFQVRRALPVTGVVDQQTWRELVEAGWRLGSRMLYLRSPNMRGDDVRELQEKLNSLGFDAGTEDGIYGRATYEAVLDFQRNSGLPADGFVGRETIEALNRLRRQIRPGSKAELRQRIARELAGGLAGRQIYLDPGHGGRDVGVLTPPGIPEASIAWRVAELASQSLAELGARPLVSRRVQEGPDLERRAKDANVRRADVAVSLHLSCRPEPGPSVAYFAVDGRFSTMGQELAKHTAEALRGRIAHPTPVLGRNLQFLRETAMPAIVVDLSAPGAETLYAEDAFLAGLADAVASGIRAYFTAVAPDA